jgi:hypothetical protein
LDGSRPNCKTALKCIGRYLETTGKPGGISEQEPEIGILRRGLCRPLGVGTGVGIISGA